MGNRSLDIEGNYTPEGYVKDFKVSIASGADLKHYGGTVVIKSSRYALDVSVGAKSVSSLSSPGHEASVKRSEVIAKGITEGLKSGIRKGFAP